MTISTDRDRVRLLIGDTDVTPDTDAIFTDDEVDAFLASRALTNAGTTSYNVVAAAADAAGAAAAKFARRFNFSEDGQSFQVAQQHGNYLALEQTLRARAGGASAQLSIAGTSST